MFLSKNSITFNSILIRSGMIRSDDQITKSLHTDFLNKKTQVNINNLSINQFFEIELFNLMQVTYFNKKERQNLVENNDNIVCSAALLISEYNKQKDYDFCIKEVVQYSQKRLINMINTFVTKINQPFFYNNKEIKFFENIEFNEISLDFTFTEEYINLLKTEQNTVVSLDDYKSVNSALGRSILLFVKSMTIKDASRFLTRKTICSVFNVVSSNLTMTFKSVLKTLEKSCVFNDIEAEKKYLYTNKDGQRVNTIKYTFSFEKTVKKVVSKVSKIVKNTVKNTTNKTALDIVNSFRNGFKSETKKAVNVQSLYVSERKDLMNDIFNMIS